MNRHAPFDEVMIVNPYDPRSNNPQLTDFMRLHQAPESYGYYAEPPEVGYYAEAPEMAYYAEPPEIGWYGEGPEGWGYYGQTDPGYSEPQEFAYYSQAPELAYYAEYPELAWYGEPEMGAYAGPVAYYAEEAPGYAEMPEMVGYREYEPLSGGYSEVEDYGEPDVSGYMRDVPLAFNAGCPLPSNVAGYAESEPLQGYMSPQDVSPTCPQFSPAPNLNPSLPPTLSPLW